MYDSIFRLPSRQLLRLLEDVDIPNATPFLFTSICIIEMRPRRRIRTHDTDSSIYRSIYPFVFYGRCVIYDTTNRQSGNTLVATEKNGKLLTGTIIYGIWVDLLLFFATMPLLIV